MGTLGIQELLIIAVMAAVYGAPLVALGFGIWKLMQVHAAVTRIEERLARRWDPGYGGERL